MAVLYRKYRPQRFADVVNQKHIIQTLKNQVAAGQVAHAYLFTGTRGVGKTSIARILAKAVNCEKKTKGGGDACGQCQICRQVEQGNFMDLVEIDAASNTGVDNIRELIEHVRFSPSAGAYKVFIIDEVHMLSKGAFNALLKTLEEPPRHAIFILATTEIGKVPATIISRTQKFDFKRLSQEDLQEHLEKILKQEKIKMPEAVVRLVAQNAEGSVRDSLSLLEKILTLGSEATLEESQQLLGITDIALCESLLDLVSQGQMAEIPDFFDNLQEKGFDLAVFNRDFLEYLRKALVFKVTGREMLQQHQERLAKIAARLSLSDLMFVIRLFLRSYKDMASSPSMEIPLLVSGLEAAAKKNNGLSSGNAAVPALPKITRQPAMEPANEPDPAVLARAEEPANDETAVSLEEVKAAWPQVVTKVREANGPLGSYLKSFPILSVSGGAITLGVNFIFHKQSLETAKNQELLSRILEGILGKRLRVKGRVVKEEAQAAAPAEALADALQIFGGELVE